MSNQCRKSKQSEFRSDEAVKGSSEGTPEYDCNLDEGPTSNDSRICYPQPPPKRRPPCLNITQWQRRTHVRDQCGSGVGPKRLHSKLNHQLWCQTPMTMYQATIGDLAKKLLCREEVVVRNVFPEPPCALTEDIQPPCYGYYRKYDCLRPCEDEYATVNPLTGKKEYRNRLDRYWDPCPQEDITDLNSYAPQNANMAAKFRRRNDDSSCW